MQVSSLVTIENPRLSDVEEPDLKYLLENTSVLFFFKLLLISLYRDREIPHHVAVRVNVLKDFECFTNYIPKVLIYLMLYPLIETFCLSISVSL